MRKIVVTKKTGFRVRNPYKPVIIRDCRGVLFYTTEPLLPKTTKFNLPQGVYYVDAGDFTPMEKPVKYKYIPLPLPERNLAFPYSFKIFFGTNKNKCTIRWYDKSILFDESLKEKPLPDLYFILYHEYSHAKFETEKWADTMAYNFMIGKGFNPSQIGIVPIRSLSSQQWNRKKHLVKRIKENV